MNNIVYMVHLIHWGDDSYDDAEDYMFFGIFTSREKAQAEIDKFIVDDYWDWVIEPVTIDKTYKWER